MPKSLLTLGFVLILVAIGVGSWATIQAIETVVPRIHPTVTVKTLMVYSYTTTVHNGDNSLSTTITTTGAAGDSATTVMAAHDEAIRLWHIAHP